VVRLPNTSPQNSRARSSFAHIRLLTAVSPTAWNASGFEGAIYKPGAQLTDEELGPNPVLIECAGPQGSWRAGKHRETLWLLWRFDFDAKDWREICRAQAFDWSWAVVLREPAIRALTPAASPSIDPIARGREVTEELLQRIDTALVTELPAVRALVLCDLYNRVAGRIVAA
jgi:hypothetical protein